MKMLMHVPCGNLIDRDPPACSAGRSVPEDCLGKPPCKRYTAGLTEQERRRAVMWLRIRAHQEAEDDEPA